MTPPTSIRTKRGWARFVDGRIEFEESMPGYARALVRDYWDGGSRGQRAICLGYAFAALYGLGFFALELSQGRWLLPAVVVGVLVVTWLVGRFRGFRSVDSLDLDRVQSVTATRGSKGLTRPRLVLSDRTDDGPRKRRLLLPSLYAVDGETAFERAVAAFEVRGVPVTGDSPR